MEVVRQVIDSSLLDKIPLPQSLKNRRVEIIIRPLEEGEKRRRYQLYQTKNCL